MILQNVQKKKKKIIHIYQIIFFFLLIFIARWLCLYLKKFCKLINLSHCFSTIGIVVMVIFYLQTKKLLPTIEYLQRDVTDANKILVGRKFKLKKNLVNFDNLCFIFAQF